jgi:hypothetical protein
MSLEGAKVLEVSSKLLRDDDDEPVPTHSCLFGTVSNGIVASHFGEPMCRRDAVD